MITDRSSAGHVKLSTDRRRVSPRLQLVRGPYPIAAGVAAYGQHRRLHPQLGVPAGRGRWPMLADRR
jgi:hypothetical protein